MLTRTEVKFILDDCEAKLLITTRALLEHVPDHGTIASLIIHQGYGLAETSSFAAYNHDSLHREGSVGTPVENVEMKIVGVEGQ